ncbi:MAG: hypothetical protein Q8R28_00840 [Dehalococcoidia bacterium]|nr:hypothetical protein [Dehalococcoidia bacterium]
MTPCFVLWHPCGAAGVYQTVGGRPQGRPAGLTISLHSTRYSFVTLLRTKGVPRATVPRFVGHTSPVNRRRVRCQRGSLFWPVADVVDYDEQMP